MPPALPVPRLARSIALPALALSAAATAAVAQTGETTGDFTYWLPENVSTFGGEVDALFHGILYLTGFVCVAVLVLLVAFLVKYRFSAGRRATFIHGNNTLEAVWTLVPAVILVFIAVMSQTSWSKIKSIQTMPSGEDVVRVNVIGRQFAWYFHYPGKDGRFGPRSNRNIPTGAQTPDEIVGLDRSHADAKDDIVAIKMVVPVKRKVQMDLSSVDVLHSFFLPNFRVKQDAVPGLIGKVWIEATRTSAEVVGTEENGDAKPFDIVCAELCGQGHFKMRGQLFVVSEQEFEAFLTQEASYLEPAEDDPGY